MKSTHIIDNLKELGVVGGRETDDPQGKNLGRHIVKKDIARSGDR